jgi:hypothetical protein
MSVVALLAMISLSSGFAPLAGAAPLLAAAAQSHANSSLPADTNDLFEAPFRVSDAKGFIDVDAGHAAPLVIDFDGDGVPDLLVGQYGEGKLRVYKNVGTASAPRFEGYVWFRAGELAGQIPSG